MRSVIKYGLSFDKAFASSIRGASKSDVMLMQDVMNRSLSSQHIEFLLTMGIHCNDLIASPDIRTTIPDVIDFYRENVLTGEEEIPDNYMLFGVGGGAIDHLLIDRTSNSIREINDVRPGKLWADTLEKLLFRRVFSRYKHLKLKRTMVFVNTDATNHPLKQCDPMLGKYGLAKLWFSDTISLSAESDTRALQIVKYEGSGWWVRVSAEDEKIIYGIIESICHVFDIHLRHQSQNVTDSSLHGTHLSSVFVPGRVYIKTPRTN